MSAEYGKETPKTVYNTVFSHGQGHGKFFFNRKSRKVGTIGVRGSGQIDGKIVRAFRLEQDGEHAVFESQIEPLNPFNFVLSLLPHANNNDTENKTAA